MKIGVLRETPAEETRTALMPESVACACCSGLSVQIESGAGVESGASDADYTAAGAQIVNDKTAILSSVDALCASTDRQLKISTNCNQGRLLLDS
jgi:alanine dehydrogenase